MYIASFGNLALYLSARFLLRVTDTLDIHRESLWCTAVFLLIAIGASLRGMRNALVVWKFKLEYFDIVFLAECDFDQSECFGCVESKWDTTERAIHFIYGKR